MPYTIMTYGLGFIFGFAAVALFRKMTPADRPILFYWGFLLTLCVFVFAFGAGEKTFNGHAAWDINLEENTIYRVHNQFEWKDNYYVSAEANFNGKLRTYKTKMKAPEPCFIVHRDTYAGFYYIKGFEKVTVEQAEPKSLPVTPKTVSTTN